PENFKDVNDLEIVLSNRINRATSDFNDGKPIYVIISAAGSSDYALTQSAGQYHQLIEKGHVMYYEVSEEKGFLSALNDATKDGEEPAKIIVLNGHGEQYSLNLYGDKFVEYGGGKLANEEHFIDISDMKELKDADVNKYLLEGGEIITDSCSTGYGEEAQANLANMLALVFPNAAHVFTPVDNAAPNAYIFDETDPAMVKDVTYQEGGSSGAAVGTYDAAAHRAEIASLRYEAETYSYDGWSVERIEAFMTAQKPESVKAPTSAQRATLVDVSANSVAPYYAQQGFGTYSFDPDTVKVVDNPTEEFSAFTYKGFMYINNAVFDDQEKLGDVIFHETYEKSLRDANPALSLQDTHQLAQNEETKYALKDLLASFYFDPAEKKVLIEAASSELLGTETLREGFENDPWGPCIFISGINDLGGIEKFKQLSELLGIDIFREGFKNDPVGVNYFMSGIKELGGIEIFNQLSSPDLLGVDVLREGFNKNLREAGAYLSGIKIMGGIEIFKQLASADLLGIDALREAFKNNPFEAGNFLSGIKDIGGIEGFKQWASPDLLGIEVLREGLKTKDVPFGESSFLSGLNEIGGIEGFKQWASPDLLGIEVLREGYKNNPWEANDFLSGIKKIGGIEKFKQLSSHELIGIEMLRESFRNGASVFVELFKNIGVFESRFEAIRQSHPELLDLNNRFNADTSRSILEKDP
ncbi:MAG: hypothetical protein NTY47_07430, partial [Candidatus Omnitrophica bacterium]|nr:hypothetical protein [Candidatus Omnitrophota bacterium]